MSVASGSIGLKADAGASVKGNVSASASATLPAKDATPKADAKPGNQPLPKASGRAGVSNSPGRQYVADDVSGYNVVRDATQYNQSWVEYDEGGNKKTNRAAEIPVQVVEDGEGNIYAAVPIPAGTPVENLPNALNAAAATAQMAGATTVNLTDGETLSAISGEIPASFNGAAFVTETPTNLLIPMDGYDPKKFDGSYWIHDPLIEEMASNPAPVEVGEVNVQLGEKNIQFPVVRMGDATYLAYDPASGEEPVNVMLAMSQANGKGVELNQQSLDEAKQTIAGKNPSKVYVKIEEFSGQSPRLDVVAAPSDHELEPASERALEFIRKRNPKIEDAQANEIIDAFNDAYRKHAAPRGIPYDEFAAQFFTQMAVESSFNRYAESGAQARGLMQIIPSTGQALGLHVPTSEEVARVGERQAWRDFYDVRKNIDAAVRYVVEEQHCNLRERGLMAYVGYHSGPHRFKTAQDYKKAGRWGRQYGYMIANASAAYLSGDLESAAYYTVHANTKKSDIDSFVTQVATGQTPADLPTSGTPVPQTYVARNVPPAPDEIPDFGVRRGDACPAGGCGRQAAAEAPANNRCPYPIEQVDPEMLIAEASTRPTLYITPGRSPVLTTNYQYDFRMDETPDYDISYDAPEQAGRGMLEKLINFFRPRSTLYYLLRDFFRLVISGRLARRQEMDVDEDSGAAEEEPREEDLFA